jgi:tetratricopeptide (TPR) repeat protein
LDILEKVIFSLTSDEVRRFKILSNRFKAEDEKKLLLLFDMVRSDKFTEEEQQIVKELYEFNNAQTRNRYYRLRNKLLENIEKSLTFYHFKYKDSIHAYYDIQLSIMFRERGGYQLALYFLKKAEKKAKELDQFNILEQIYQEYTQLAMKDIEIDIEEILERRKSNLEKVKINRKNSEAIAMLTQHLKRSNFSREKASVIELMEKAKKNIEASAEIFHSTEGKIQIFRIVSALLLQKEAYDQLVAFAKTTIKELEDGNQFSNDNHGDRLFMRLWLANALYKTCKFAEAESQLEIFEKEMVMYRKQNYFTYLFHYTNARINVLKCLGRNDEAGKLIQEALEIRELRSEPEHEALLVRSLADFQFLKADYAAASKTITDLKKMAGYELFSQAAKMFLDVFEMVVKLETGDTAFAVNTYSAFKKNYRKLLKSELHERVTLFIELLLKVCAATEKGKAASLKGQLVKLQELIGENEHGSNEIILYDLFLVAKTGGRSYYDLFLQKMGRIKS